MTAGFDRCYLVNLDSFQFRQKTLIPISTLHDNSLHLYLTFSSTIIETPRYNINSIILFSNFLNKINTLGVECISSPFFHLFLMTIERYETKVNYISTTH